MSWSSRDGPSAPARARRRFAAAMPVVLAMTHAPAVAQTVPRLEVELSVLASENPLLLTGDDTGAVQTDLSARPGVRITTPTGSSFDLGAVITNRNYSRRFGNFVVGRVDAAADYRDSERLSIGAEASFSRDLAVDLLTGSVEAAVDPTSVRTGYGGRLSLAWRPDEYTSVLPAIGIDRFSFDRTNLLGDTRSIDASLAVRRRTGPRTTLGARAGAIFSDTARLSSTDTRFLYATIDRRLGASWRLTGELGLERAGARTETLLGATVAQPPRTRVSGRAELCRDRPDPVICLTAALNSEVSGLGGLQRRGVLTASFDQRLDERTTLGVDAEYQRTVMQADVFPDFDAVRAVATLERSVTREWRIGATLQYLRRRLVDGSRIGSGFAGLRLTYAPALR
jgi:hypothetical protein